jgi:hypothetical protein
LRKRGTLERAERSPEFCDSLEMRRRFQEQACAELYVAHFELEMAAAAATNAVTQVAERRDRDPEGAQGGLQAQEFVGSEDARGAAVNSGISAVRRRVFE